MFEVYICTHSQQGWQKLTQAIVTLTIFISFSLLFYLDRDNLILPNTDA
jgi:uncharacterized protein (DUF486 family)